MSSKRAKRQRKEIRRAVDTKVGAALDPIRQLTFRERLAVAAAVLFCRPPRIPKQKGPKR